jgi:effector-binding domain-containing protein
VSANTVTADRLGQVRRSVLVAAVLASVSVPYQVRTERATPRVLAAIRANTTPQRLSSDIIGLLDQVWPVLREQGIRTGHNVVVYHPGEAGVLTVDAGVEVFSEFAGSGAVRCMATPAGEVAATAHYGEYSAMAGAYQALEQWCTANSRQPAGVNWEVYGDWDDDPSNRRTDVYVLLSPAGRGESRPG